MSCNSKVTDDRALVVFRMQTPATTSTVHLLGSWDNFSSPLLMALDKQTTAGLWKICLGSSTLGNGSASRGLKMGARYTYYFMLDGHLPTVDHTLRERDVDARTGIACSVLHVPIEVPPGVRLEANSPELSCAPVARSARNINVETGIVYGLGLDLMTSSCTSFQEQKPKQRPTRPTVTIPTTIPENDNLSSANIHNISFVNSGWNKVSLNTPVSSVPSSTPTTTFSGPLSPASTMSSFGTPAPSASLRTKKSFGFGFGRGDRESEISELETQSPAVSLPEKERKRAGFHLKNSSIAALSNMIAGNSTKSRTNFPIISNPIPINLDVTSGAQQRARRSPESATVNSEEHAEYCYEDSVKFQMMVQKSSPESKSVTFAQDATIPRSMALPADFLSLPPRHRNMSPLSRCTSIDSTCSSNDSSPSLVQSEFSGESTPSPDNLSSSSICSSPMGSQFDTDIEIDDDDESSYFVDTIRGNLYGERRGRGSMELVGDDNVDDMENWYRNATAGSAMKSRFSSISSKTNVTKISSDRSSNFTQFEDSQEFLHNHHMYTKKKRSPKPAPQLYAPVPQRLGAKDIVTIEGLAEEVGESANSEYVTTLAGLRLEAENSQMDRQQLIREMGWVGPNVV